MKEHGIIFNSEMVRAILDGRKTQTRRPVDDKTLYYFDVAVQVGECHSLGANEEIPFDAYHLDWCPYGKKGDIIPFADKDGNIKGEIEIANVWLQQVKDISEEDAIAEGVVTGRYGNEGNWLRGFYAPGGNQPHQNAKSAYSEIWRSIYGADAWYKNPWVWVIEFTQIQG